VSHCEVTLICRSVCAAETGGQTHTVQSNGDAFRQHMAIRADENRHLAQRVQLQQLFVILFVLLVCIHDVQLQALRFRDGERGGGARVGLDGSRASVLCYWGLGLGRAAHLVRVERAKRHAGPGRIARWWVDGRGWFGLLGEHSILGLYQVRARTRLAVARTGSIPEMGSPGPRVLGYRFPTMGFPSHGFGSHAISFAGRCPMFRRMLGERNLGISGNVHIQA